MNPRSTDCEAHALTTTPSPQDFVTLHYIVDIDILTGNISAKAKILAMLASLTAPFVLNIEIDNVV